MSVPRASFDVGQVIHHRLFDYRGVIIGVDPVFSASDQWYEQVARSRPPRDAPWYHVLVDGADHRTYVAECNLEPDTATQPIRHPELGRFLGAFEDGRYAPLEPVH